MPIYLLALVVQVKPVPQNFAKAINCKHSQDGEPCNVCETCVAITEGRLNDVIEIDAASNNGVEEIRDIRDKAKYAPTQASTKFILLMKFICYQLARSMHF